MAVRFALAQINTVVGDMEFNLAAIKSSIKRAKDQGAEVVIFPELTLTGYPPEDLLFRASFIKKNLQTLQKLAAFAKDLVVCVGYVRSEKNRLYNSMAVISGGKVIGSYDKMHLPNYSVFDEKRYFKAGTQPVLLEVKGGRFVLSICEDLWVEDGPVEKACRRTPIDAVINISCSPYFMSKMKSRMDLVRFKSISNKTTMLYCNLVGGQDELIFDGGSMVSDPQGKVTRLSPQFQEDILVVDVPVDPKKRKKISQDIKVFRAKQKRAGASKPLVPASVQVPASEVEEVYNALVLGIRDYVRKSGFAKVGIGSSGGIDSAVVACLAVKALGAENVKTVTMPSKYSSQATFQDALRLGKNLRVEVKTLPIKPAYDAYLKSLKAEFKGRPFDATEENIQARIRGNLLMALSNKYGWLILTTGNKSEVSVGYCTLYGDMAGGFGVIKDVYKTLVYDLARYINRDTEIIPVSIIERAPSAELRPNQKDQDSLPPYDILDNILEHYIENDSSPETIIQLGFDPKIVRKVVRLVDMNEYKRRQAAIGIKITPKAFGKDRRMPIVNHFYD